MSFIAPLLKYKEIELAWNLFLKPFVPALNPDISQIYAHLDRTQLSWLETQWIAWYKMIGNPTLATGLLGIIFHEVAYFGRCVPWLIIDAIPYFRKWKLQPDKVISPAKQLELTNLVLFNHFLMQVPTLWLWPLTSELVGMATYEVPLPSFKMIAFHCTVFFIYEDFFHYCAHRTLHTRILYKYLHKVHHECSAPFGLAAEYGHPIEVAGLSLGGIVGAFIYCFFMRDVHVFTVFIWVSLRLWQAVDAHSGYDFPWSLQRILPFWAGAEHHDYHHMSGSNNYASSFRWCDLLFGTDIRYRAYRARQKAKEIEAKNL